MTAVWFSRGRWRWWLGGGLAGGALASGVVFRLAGGRLTTVQTAGARAGEAGAANGSSVVAAWLAGSAAAGVDLPTAGAEGALAAEHAQAAAMHTLRQRLAAAPVAEFPAWAGALFGATGDRARVARECVVATWIDRDPAGAVRWLAGFADRERAEAAGEALLAWAGSDPAAARAWVLALPAGEVRARLLSRWLVARVATDLAEARALAEAEPGEAGAAARREVFKAWAKADPATALPAWGTAVAADPSWGDALRDAVRSWAERAPAAAWRWVLETRGFTPERQRDLAMNLLWSGPREVLVPAIAAGPPRPREMEQVLRSAIFDWVVNAPATAGAWLDGLADAKYRKALVADLAGWTRGDQPEFSLPLIERLPAGADRERKIEAALASWAKRAPEAALAWAEGRGDPALAATTRAAVLGSLAREEPELALAHWQTLPDGLGKLTSAHQLAAGWAQQDPSAAIAWLATTAAPADVDAWRQVLGSWAGQAPVATLNQLTTLPAGPSRDAALQAWGWSQRGADDVPATVAALAAWEPGSLRDGILRNLATTWLRTDYVAAEAWLESTPVFTPQEKTALRQQTAPLRAAGGGR